MNTGPTTVKYIVKDGLLRRRADGEMIRRVGTSGWFDWLQLETTKSFHYLGESGQHATVCKEKRIGGSGGTHYYFIAYRKVASKRRRVYLGKARKVTLRALEQAAGKLAQLALKAESGKPDAPRPAPPATARQASLDIV